MSLPIYVVDAFADKAFAGNPAAVCLLDGKRDEAWMQAVAAEMKHSETAFLTARGGRKGYDLRWFTPVTEVDLCGHATLASAHVLWNERGEFGDKLIFHTKSGPLYALRAGSGIELDFPAQPASPVEAPPGLAQALGMEPLAVAKNVYDYLVHVADAEAVRGLAPDFAALRRIPARGFMVTAAGDGGYDFISRFFAPAAGIDEDPVTGSAHCCLGPWWEALLGKREFLAYQASPRGGVVRVRNAGGRVILSGPAVTVLQGEWHG